jgi:hypothetical protein
MAHTYFRLYVMASWGSLFLAWNFIHVTFSFFSAGHLYLNFLPPFLSEGFLTRFEREVG